jgi:hypothetical protein
MVTTKETTQPEAERLFKNYRANIESRESALRFISELDETIDELSSKLQKSGHLMYRGFIAEVYDPEAIDGPANGKLIGIPDLVTFEAPFEDLSHYFEEAVDDHIDMLVKLGRPLVGSFGIVLEEFNV